LFIFRDQKELSLVIYC